MPKEKSKDVRLLETEKRVIDLEIAVSGIKEKLKTIDVQKISEAIKRIEDLEDLIVVDNAGILEIKKMLGEKRADVEEKVKQIDTLIAEIRSIKEKLQEISAKGMELPPNLMEDIKNIKIELNLRKEDLKSLESTIQKTNSELSELKSSITSLSKIKEELETMKVMVRKIGVSSELPIEGLAENINNLRTMVFLQKGDIDNFNSILKRVTEEIESIKANLSLLQKDVMRTPKPILDELKVLKEDLASNKFEISSLKKSLSDLKLEMKPLADLDEIRNLKKELEEKIEIIERFRTAPDVELANDISRIRGKLKLLTEQVGNVMKIAEDAISVKRFEDEISSIKEQLAESSKEVSRALVELEKNKKSIWEKAGKRELEELKKELVEREKEERERMRKEFRKMVSTVSTLSEELEVIKKFEEGVKSQKVELKLLSEQVTTLENKFAAIEAKTESNKNKLASVSSVLTHVKEQLSAIENIQTELKHIREISRKFREAQRALQVIKTNIESLSVEVEKNKKDLLMAATKDELEKVKVEIRAKEAVKPELASEELERLKREIGELKLAIGEIKSVHTKFQPDLVKELINKLVYLESRVIALEKIVSELPAQKPIIIE